MFKEKVTDSEKNKILIVEDSDFFRRIIQRNILSILDVEILYSGTKAGGIELLKRHQDEIFVSVLDLHLPDASDLDIVESFQEYDAPMVVFTSTYSEDLRERILSRKVIDYVVKNNPASLQYLTSLLKRLYRNRSATALVVDDSRTAREYMCDLLHRYQLNTREAGDGDEALSILKDDPSIKLVITDYHMPGMDGFELIKNIRQVFHLDDLPVIGVSTSGSATLSAKFIKHGANDFLSKPFLREEFFCRVSQNLTQAEYVQELKEAALLDPLTKINNRTAFFNHAGACLDAAKRSNARPALGLIDLDFFKEVNDNYGHLAGDHVLIGVASLLKKFLRRNTDIACRLGGEEFGVFLFDIEPEMVHGYFEELRKEIEALEIVHNGETIKVTASIGICMEKEVEVMGMLEKADRSLYDAKREGRNRVIMP